jgi:predicted metalloprotease with PDZ domain
MRQTLGRKDKGGKKREKSKPPPVSIGATIASRDGKAVFTTISNGGAAEIAGVAPGDTAVALDGLALTAANFDRRLNSCRVNDVMILVVFRGDELLTLSLRFQAPAEDTCYLELLEDVDLDVETRRAAWLAG